MPPCYPATDSFSHFYAYHNSHFYAYHNSHSFADATPNLGKWFPIGRCCS
jgi:hypothetical protein